MQAILKKLRSGNRDPQLIDELGIKLEERLGYPSGSLAGVFKAPEPIGEAGGERHERWKNQLNNQVVEPLQLCKPTTLSEIGHILTDALRNGVLVKAAGSGHSYSDVATTPDYFIDTHGLRRIADEVNPIAAQLDQSVVKNEWRAATMKSKWRPIDDLPDITVESPLDDILRVRDVFENNTMLFETEAGITIESLNHALGEADLGLPNMGGYDGQTIMGAISTSTHGTGIAIPPFPDMLRSLVLVTTGKWNGKVISGNGLSTGPVNFYRIEPSNGITDPQQYNRSQHSYSSDGVEIQLIQDNDCFRSVMVNMGTMGVVYSVVIEVMQFYHLTETRTISSLDKSLALIEPVGPSADNPEGMPSVMRRYRHFQILVNPYPMHDGKVIDVDPSEPAEKYYPHFQTLNVQMNITPRDKHNLPGHRVHPRLPGFVTALTSKLGASSGLLTFLLNAYPKAIPDIISTSLLALKDTNHVDKSYRVYNLGVDGEAGFANEIGFPVQTAEGSFTREHIEKAVDSIHRVARTARLQGDQYQTSPFAIRFVKRSAAYLSMMNGVDTAMIELPMITGTYGGKEVLNRQHRALYHLGGRPHWGLEFDQFTANDALLQKMYPEYERWKRVYDQLNSEGTFNNQTTLRLGLSHVDYKSSIV